MAVYLICLKFPVKIYDKGEHVVVFIFSYKSVVWIAVVDLCITQVDVFQRTPDGQFFTFFELGAYGIADLPINRHVGRTVFGIHRRGVVGNTELKQHRL